MLVPASHISFPTPGIDLNDNFVTYVMVHAFDSNYQTVVQDIFTKNANRFCPQKKNTMRERGKEMLCIWYHNVIVRTFFVQQTRAREGV